MQTINVNTDATRRGQIFYALEFLFLICIFILTYVVFLTVGPENFADYLAYVYYNPGVRLQDFLFEFIPRTILAYDGSFIGDFNSADNLILFCGVWAGFFLILSTNGSARLLHAFVVFACLFFPFILTTGLRVSPSYPCFFLIFYWLNLQKISLNQAILIMIPVSMMFHDSVILVVAFFIGIKFINIGRFSEQKLVSFFLISSILLLFARELIPLQALIFLAETYLGGRSVYVGGNIGSGYAVSVYFFAIWLLALFACRDQDVSREVKLICVAFLFFSCLLANIAPVASIRISHFLLIMLVASRANLFGRWELSNGNNLLSFPLYLGVFYIQFLGVIIK